MRRIDWLTSNGFIVGDRDPLMNTDHAGTFMVAEHYDKGHTQKDGGERHSVWCLVGDHLEDLIDDAYLFFKDEDN